MESQSIAADSFLMKRRQIMLERLKSRRDQIFNKTRNILNHEDGQNTKQPFLIKKKQWDLAQEEKAVKESELKKQEIQPQNSQKEISKNKPKKYKKNKKLPFYCNFQYPDWMIEIPSDIADFYILPRPKGQKVLLIFKHNKLLVYSQQGLTKTQIMISSKHYDGTVLEGYYIKNQGSQNILISDLLIWRKNQMVSSQFQFRLAWLYSNLNVNILNEISVSNKRNLTLKLLEYAPYSAQCLLKLYQNICNFNTSNKLSYQIDGILFIHKQSFYLYEVNPHVLLWKDENIQKISLSKTQNLQNKPKSIFDINSGIQVQKNSQLMTQENDYIDIEQNSTKNVKNMNPFFSSSNKTKYNCEYQLGKLSLNNETINQHVFYGKMTKNGNIFTFDDVFLIWVQNQTQSQQKIVKFSFTEMNYELNKVNQHPKNSFSQMEEQTTQQNITISFNNFIIHQTFQIHRRIPDCLSKIIFKYKMKQNIKRKTQAQTQTLQIVNNQFKQIDQNPTIQEILNSHTNSQQIQQNQMMN